jgi:hypothetical protein
MRVKILGKYWTLKYEYPGKGLDGLCDHPETPNKTIIVKKNLDGKTELCTLLHEIFHSIAWSVDEEYIDRASTDLSEILWKLGYRKLSKEELKKHQKS